MAKRYRVTRDILDGHPNNWAGRDVRKGEEFDEFDGATYGCCDESYGVVLKRASSDTFFEFPRDAVERVIK